jgi:hypothetical protein
MMSKQEVREQISDTVQDGVISSPDHGTVAPVVQGDIRDLNRASSIPGFRARPFRQPRNHRLLRVQEALLSIYGTNGPPLGETAEIRLWKVNAWLMPSKVTISKATLGRAEKKLNQKLEHNE